MVACNYRNCPATLIIEEEHRLLHTFLSSYTNHHTYSNIFNCSTDFSHSKQTPPLRSLLESLIWPLSHFSIAAICADSRLYLDFSFFIQTPTTCPLLTPRKKMTKFSKNTHFRNSTFSLS